MGIMSVAKYPAGLGCMWFISFFHNLRCFIRAVVKCLADVCAECVNCSGYVPCSPSFV